MGGPQRDSLEMETPLQKTFSVHKMEGGIQSRESIEGERKTGYQMFYRVR